MEGHMHCERRQVVGSRREFLLRSSFGFGWLALANLLSGESQAATIAPAPDPLAPSPPHFPGKARSVVFLFMEGGPSHVDTFDPKPELTRYDGQPLPSSFRSDDLHLQFI